MPPEKSVGTTRLDLGCGDLKDPGFIGVDLRPGDQVDVVADLDRPLPFRDDSVDLVVASHALEHVRDLLQTMKEIYRICRHGAQVCIVAPYSEQKLNYANPHHLAAFNEHTPRFWTNHPVSGIPPEDYWHPHAAAWGLASSDRSNPGIDFRCERIEFFYFPEFGALSESEKRVLRKQRIDVCDQIMYNLIVYKGGSGTSRADIEETPPYEPSHVTRRRLGEELELARRERVARDAELAGLREERSRLEAELAARDAKANRDREQALLESRAGFESLQGIVQKIRGLLAEREARLGEVEADLQAERAASRDREQALLESRAGFESLQGSVQEIRGLLAEREAKLGEVEAGLQAERAALAIARCEVGVWQRCGEAAIRELEAFRQRRSVRFVNRLLEWSDAWNDVGPPFQQLKDDSVIFGRGRRGFRLRPSVNLQAIPFLGYRIRLDRPNLRGLLFAAILDAPQRDGHLGIEIVSPDGRMLVQRLVPMSQVKDSEPVAFDFPPLRDPGVAAYFLRVFCRNVRLPVRIFELRWHGFGWPRRYFVQPFCGFVFGRERSEDP